MGRILTLKKGVTRDYLEDHSAKSGRVDDYGSCRMVIWGYRGQEGRGEGCGVGLLLDHGRGEIVDGGNIIQDIRGMVELERFVFRGGLVCALGHHWMAGDGKRGGKGRGTDLTHGQGDTKSNLSYSTAWFDEQ